MARETLPVDGARYQCSFAFVRYEDFRCNKNATEALDSETFMRYTDIMGKYVVLHGRAMCERHLTLCEDALGI